jgi:hypothetical protein
MSSRAQKAEERRAAAVRFLVSVSAAAALAVVLLDVLVWRP